MRGRRLVNREESSICTLEENKVIVAVILA